MVLFRIRVVQVLFASEKVFVEALKECDQIKQEAVGNYIFDEGEFNGVKVSKFAYYHSSEEFDDDIIDIIDAHFEDRDEDDYSQVEDLTQFVFEGGFSSLVEKKAKELNETILSHEEGC